MSLSTWPSNGSGAAVTGGARAHAVEPFGGMAGVAGRGHDGEARMGVGAVAGRAGLAVVGLLCLRAGGSRCRWLAPADRCRRGGAWARCCGRRCRRRSLPGAERSRGRRHSWRRWGRACPGPGCGTTSRWLPWWSCPGGSSCISGSAPADRGGTRCISGTRAVPHGGRRRNPGLRRGRTREGREAPVGTAANTTRAAASRRTAAISRGRLRERHVSGL